MKLTTLAGLITSGQLALLLGLGNTIRQAYRSSFIAAALSEGVYALLREGPTSLDELHQRLMGPLPAEDPSREKLKAWLDLGVTLGELKQTPAGYALRSRLSRQLARPSNDAIAALFQEACTLHHDLITQMPARLRERRPFTLADADGELIARSSRVLEPYISEIVDTVVPEKGACRLLEVGCGSGVYIQRACLRNPALVAVGLELQPEVANAARRNLEGWGLAQRARVETGDIRAFAGAENFDLVTLHNNIYYFPVGERLDLVRRLTHLLKPRGTLLVTTACQGSPATQVLNLWGEMSEGAGALPEPDAVCDLMRQAGCGNLRRWELLPGQGFFAFVGTRI